MKASTVDSATNASIANCSPVCSKRSVSSGLSVTITTPAAPTVRSTTAPRGISRRTFTPSSRLRSGPPSRALPPSGACHCPQPQTLRQEQSITRSVSYSEWSRSVSPVKLYCYCLRFNPAPYNSYPVTTPISESRIVQSSVPIFAGWSMKRRIASPSSSVEKGFVIRPEMPALRRDFSVSCPANPVMITIGVYE